MVMCSLKGKSPIQREPTTWHSVSDGWHRVWRKRCSLCLWARMNFSVKLSRALIMASYKKEYPYLVESIVTECDIYSAEGHKFHTERAMWDTGADTTIISSRIVKELKLQLYKQGGIAGILDAGGRLLPPPDASLVHGIIGWSRRYRSCWLEVGFAGMTAEPIPLPPSNPRCLPSPLSNAYAR